MLKMTGLDVLFAAAGNLYLLLALVGIGVALWKGKTKLRKVIYAALVLALFIAPVAPQAFRQIEYRNKLAKAQALFDERCKTAGERIHRTVDNVEGILLMKLRPDGVNYGEQFKMDDPYGSDYGGEGYLLGFMRGYHPHSMPPVPGAPPRIGYRYVDAVDSKDGERYRYTGSRKSVGRMDANAPNVQVDLKRDPNFDLNIYRFILDKIHATGATPRYGVTYDDISTGRDRDYWIAGSSLKVIDLQTNEVIAERIGYMMDRAQGSIAGGRSPWLLAANLACPGFQRSPLRPIQPGRGSSAQLGQTLDFVEKVLIPTQEKQP